MYHIIQKLNKDNGIKIIINSNDNYGNDTEKIILVSAEGVEHQVHNKIINLIPELNKYNCNIKHSRKIINLNDINNKDLSNLLSIIDIINSNDNLYINDNHLELLTLNEIIILTILSKKLKINDLFSKCRGLMKKIINMSNDDFNNKYI